MRNFASMTAITIALNSSHIRRLPLTGRWIPDEKKRLLAEFEKIVDPSSNHRTYRAALAEVIDQEYAGNCIPWLGLFFLVLRGCMYLRSVVCSCTPSRASFPPSATPTGRYQK